MFVRAAALVLVLALAATLPVPLSACAMLMAPAECAPAPHCLGMDVEPSAPAAELVAAMPCCQTAAAQPQAPGAIKKDAAPEVTFVRLTADTDLAVPAGPAFGIQADSSRKVSPPERQALLCVFLI